MECPFKEQLNNGSMVCDFGGLRHEPDVTQYPTEILNKCQSDDEPVLNGYRRLFIMRKDLKTSPGKLAVTANLKL